MHELNTLSFSHILMKCHSLWISATAVYLQIQVFCLGTKNSLKHCWLKCLRRQKNLMKLGKLSILTQNFHLTITFDNLSQHVLLFHITFTDIDNHQISFPH